MCPYHLNHFHCHIQTQLSFITHPTLTFSPRNGWYFLQKFTTQVFRFLFVHEFRSNQTAINTKYCMDHFYHAQVVRDSEHIIYFPIHELRTHQYFLILNAFTNRNTYNHGNLFHPRWIVCSIVFAYIVNNNSAQRNNPQLHWLWYTYLYILNK